jgi:hypothetical protein
MVIAPCLGVVMVTPPIRRLERYVLGPAFASGGMATLHLARPLASSRVVVIKKLLPDRARDQSFVRMLVDEFELLSRVRHKNVVAPIEYLCADGEVCIVMEYVEGESLARLMALKRAPLPAAICSKILTDVLAGLHAAHEATDRYGQPLNIVHRDVSPHNILVGTDGGARIADFGIAKAASRSQETHHGERKGKPGYMAPEQLAFAGVDRRTDVYAAGIVLWELLTGRRLLDAEEGTPAAAQRQVHASLRPSLMAPGVPPAFDAIVLRALSPQPSDRFADAREMADVMIDAGPLARDVEVGASVARLARVELEARARWVADLEGMTMASLEEASAAWGARAPTPAGTGRTRAVARSTRRSAEQGFGFSRSPRRKPSFGREDGAFARRRRLAWLTVGAVLIVATAYIGGIDPRDPTIEPGKAQAASPETRPVSPAPSPHDPNAAPTSRAVVEVLPPFNAAALSARPTDARLSISEAVGPTRTATSSPRPKPALPSPRVQTAEVVETSPDPATDAAPTAYDPLADPNRE